MIESGYCFARAKSGVSILLAFDSRLDRKLEAYATETPTRSFDFDVPQSFFEGLAD